MKTENKERNVKASCEKQDEHISITNSRAPHSSIVCMYPRRQQFSNQNHYQLDGQEPSDSM